LIDNGSVKGDSQAEIDIRALAVDFDKKTWKDDAAAFRATGHELNVPATVERSRLGNGAHIWIFFERPVPAAVARRLGSLLLTRTDLTGVFCTS
jgi:hypothetical protein